MISDNCCRLKKKKTKGRKIRNKGKMKVNVILVLVALALGLVEAARRRNRLVTTTTRSLVNRPFAGQPEGQCQRSQNEILELRLLEIVTIIETIIEN